MMLIKTFELQKKVNPMALLIKCYGEFLGKNGTNGSVLL